MVMNNHGDNMCGLKFVHMSGGHMSSAGIINFWRLKDMALISEQGK